MEGSENSDKVHPQPASDRIIRSIASQRGANISNNVPISFAKELDEIPPSHHKCYECYRSCCGAFLGCLGIICCCKYSPYTIVPQGCAGIKKRFGKAYRVVDPGLYYINPLCEDMTLVNTKMLYTNIPKQMVTTRDNVAINIDSIVYWHIMDPFITMYHLANITEALKQRTMSTLRDTVGIYSLQDVVENRKALSESIKGIIGKTASSWGIFIESILINELRFSAELQNDLSATAQQVRLGQSKVICAQAEVQSAKLVREASEILNTPSAIKLRHLKTMLGLTFTRGTHIIFTPNKASFMKSSKK